MYLLLAAAIAALPRLMFRFGGEDPVKGAPWHHEDITRRGAAAAAWTTGPLDLDDVDASTAGSGLAWHADYVDSYLYNQLWNAGGGVGRFKAALLAHDELIKVHFDDLTSTAQIDLMWARYLGGTVAGLLWACDRDDLPAARHVVGVGLHAAQDFYSHSSWVDVKARRETTWLDLPVEQRAELELYSGTYELPEHFGIKPHGKLSLDCSMMRDIVGADMMNLLCDGISPLSDTSLCRRWRDCQTNSEPGRPTTVEGVPIPADIVWLQPPGIALDSTWLARIGAHHRDLSPADRADPDIAEKLFDAAKGLAIEHTAAWLVELGRIMTRIGPKETDFWSRLTTTGRQGPQAGPSLPILSGYLRSYAEDIKQYEQRNKLPLTFLSAGSYPPAPTGKDEGWFVRLELRTADDEANTGTDADIDVKIFDSTFRLDHGHKDNRLLEFNDFGAGDQTWYVVGPFDRRPAEMTLLNRGGGVLDILEGAWNDLKNAVESLVESVGEFLLSLFGGNADYCGTDKLTWTWTELVEIAGRGATGIAIEFHPFVEGEGDYRILGRLRTTFQPDGSLQATVQLQTLHCVHESTVDQGSSDDEPFVLLVVNSPGAGVLTKGRSRRFKNMDSGESIGMDMPEFRIMVPRHGALIVPVQVWESDDEGSDKRDEILEEFAGRYLGETEGFRSEFLDAVGAAIAPDWKLNTVDAYAFRRGYLTRVARLAQDKQVNRWVEAGGSQTVRFDKTPVRTVEVAALRPAPQTAVLTPGAALGSVAVSGGKVLATVRPADDQAAPGTLRRLGQHLEAGVTATPPAGVRNLAADPVNDRLYVVGTDGAVGVHDATTLARLGSAPVGFGVYDVAVHPESKLVWVSRWRVTGGAVHVFRAGDLAPVTTLAPPGAFHGPAGIAAHPDGTRAFLARGFRSGGPGGPLVSGVSVLTLAGGQLQETFVDFGDPGIQPVDVAVDGPAGLAYVACLGSPDFAPRLVLVDARGVPKIVGTVLLPGNPHSVAVRPGSGIAYAATDRGLCLVDGPAATLLVTMPLGTQPGAVAVDPASGAAFVGDLRDGTVSRIDTAAILG